MNILITSAGRRVSLVRAFSKELRSLIGGGHVFTADMNPYLSSACRVSDGFFKVPHAASREYCKNLVGICLENKIGMVIPTIDTELIPLAENRSMFLENNIELIVSDAGFVQLCRDKRLTHSFFDRLEIERPSEIDRGSPVYPFFVKPFDGSSSIGARVIRSEAELTDHMVMDKKLLFLEYLDPRDYTEFTIDLYFDRNGVLKCAVPRERLEVRGGEISKGVTRRGDVYDLVCAKFSESKEMRGCITLQLFRNNITGKVKAIEINPRFGGGYPLSYRAGANYPGMMIREYLLGESIPFFENWKDNSLMLRYDDEIIVDDYTG